MSKTSPTPWKVYGITAALAVGAGGLAGRHAPPVSDASAESIMWARPGAAAALQAGQQQVPEAGEVLAAPPKPMKIGFINSQAVFELHPRVPELRTALESQILMWQQEQTDLQATAQQLQNDLRTAQLSPTQRRSKEQELQRSLEELAVYQNEIWAQGGRAEQKEAELMQPIIQQIDQAIGDIAESSGFDLIFDAGSGGLLFGHRSLDLTRVILERLGIPVPDQGPPPPGR